MRSPRAGEHGSGDRTRSSLDPGPEQVAAAAYPGDMAREAETPLGRALKRLTRVASTREEARRWYERYLATLGARAVVDTCNGGTLSWVHRRAEGSAEVLPLPSVQWTKQQTGERLLEGITIHDGRQYVTILYGDDGRLVETSRDERYPGRLVELGRVLAKAADAFAESVEFVARLGDESQGPGRIHYPVPVPGGVVGVWRTGLMGCRRALFDGRVDPSARFVIADGLEGRAVGARTTREEAQAAYAREVARALPEQRRVVHTSTDDYDDDGNLLARGELPPGFEDAPPSEVSPEDDPASEPFEESESWRGESERSPFEAEVDPITGRLEWGPILFRGPASDAPPVPHRPECVPRVLLPLDPSPDSPPPLGRWVRLLGELGVTRHAVRIEERDGFLLVGFDLLGLVEPRGLGARLDRIDAEAEPAGTSSFSEHDRFVRYRARQYRWNPASETRPEGLAASGGSSGNRFDAGALDGDVLQAQVRRQVRVLRPVD
jgi:hypothetical protein